MYVREYYAAFIRVLTYGKDNIMDIIERMRAYEPIAWDQIPDLGLYKDQVITFIERQYAPLYGESASRLLTPSMINNYVKMGVISRPDGKKYCREQLAALSMLVVLKQANSIDDVTRLMNAEQGASIRDVYSAFCDYLKASLTEYATTLAAADASALHLAVGAAVGSLACEAILNSANPERGKLKKK